MHNGSSPASYGLILIVLGAVTGCTASGSSGATSPVSPLTASTPPSVSTAPSVSTPPSVSTSMAQVPFPTSGPVPPSIGNDVIGGAMCAAANAWWVDTDGHPEVQVLAPAVAEVSVDFLGAGGELLGTAQTGQISEGRDGIHLVGTDVRSVDVKAVSLAIAGSQLGSCVVAKA